MGIRGDRVGMATKAALEPSQLETHITSLMRASFGRLKVLSSSVDAASLVGLSWLLMTCVQNSCFVAAAAEHTFAVHMQHCMQTDWSPSVTTLLQAAVPSKLCQLGCVFVHVAAYLQSIALLHMLWKGATAG